MTNTDSRISTVLAAKVAHRAANGQPPGPGSHDALPRKRKVLHSCIRKFGGGAETYAEFPDVLSAIRCAESSVAGISELRGGS